MDKVESEVRLGQEELIFTLSKIMPVVVSYLLLAFSYGILAYDAGLSLAWTSLCSIIVYSGAGQMTLVSLIKEGASLPVILILGLALSSRMAFYGLSLLKKYKAAGPFYPYLVLTMTDETYSLMVSLDYPDHVNEAGVDVFISFFLHLSWILGSVLGHVFGQSFNISIPGLDFMLTALFITVVIGKWRAGSKFAVLAGVGSAILSYLLFGQDAFILPAILLSLALILMEWKVKEGMLNG